MKPTRDIDQRRRTRHSPARVIVRDRQRLMHGEPLCQAPPFPGSTTTLDAWVDCPKCLALMEVKS